MSQIENRHNQQIKPAPFLKWVGGKSRLLDQFSRLFPARFNRYYEPFLGGGAVFFHLRPTSATLNDFNPNLIAAYRHIQTHLDELLVVLHELQAEYYATPPELQAQEYYRIRQRYNLLPSGSIEKSALLIFLNKTGYNGLYRESKRGYNVPFGRYDNPAIFNEANLRAVAEALQGVELLKTSFARAVETAQAQDFVYFDPPYLPLSKTASFTSYTQNEFGSKQQTELAQLARQLAERGVLVMLSNSDTTLIRELYQDFERHEVKAGRAVNSNPDRRGKISELVITSYKPGKQA
jgi:DNA adenine methylase